MKVAFWGLGIMVLGILGIILINLFGNIAVTNQLNYTTMKNAVEVSMIDAIDMSYYRSGFCVCTDNKKSSKTNVTSFTDKNQYELLDITYKDGKETCDSTKKCVILHGEYRIDKKAFSESIIRRFAEMSNNNKNYELVIQEIIEYPPKASVRVNSLDDNFFPTDEDSGGYTIVNQMDSIIESWNGLPTPMSAPKITCNDKTYNGKDQQIAKCKDGVFTKKGSTYLDDGKDTYSAKNIGDYKLLCENEDGEVTKTCKIEPTPAPNNNGGGGGSCSWSYTGHAYCNDGERIKVTGSNPSSCKGAYDACARGLSSGCSSHGGIKSSSCQGYQLRKVIEIKTNKTLSPRASYTCNDSSGRLSYPGYCNGPTYKCVC